MVTLTREQITDWRRRGYTYKEMAEKSGLCVSTIRKYMDQYGLSGRRHVTEADRETFRRKAWERGRSQAGTGLPTAPFTSC